MKALYNKQKLTLLFLMSFVSVLLITAQENEKTKVIRKEFVLNQNSRFELFNKYGNINIINKVGNELSINVTVKINGRDYERTDELLNMININIYQEGNIIKAITEIDEDFGKYFRGFHSDNNGLQINYEVSMPNNLPLTLSNKYGNVFIDEIIATSTIDVKYGKLTANRIIHDSKQPLTKIYLAYSSGSIQETKWLEADIKYSKLNINESKALAIISKYSKIDITTGSSIVSESKYDTYEIDKLVNLVTTAAYGHFSINSLSGKLQLETKYTDVNVDHIPAGFEGIKITNSYGSYKLGIESGASYKINGYAKYCNISYANADARVSRFNENNEVKVTGIIGNNQNPKAEVNITSHYGNIRLIP